MPSFTFLVTFWTMWLMRSSLAPMRRSVSTIFSGLNCTRSPLFLTMIIDRSLQRGPARARAGELGRRHGKEEQRHGAQDDRRAARQVQIIGKRQAGDGRNGGDGHRDRPGRPEAHAE